MCRHRCQPVAEPVLGVWAATVGPAGRRANPCDGFSPAEMRGRHPFVGSHKEEDSPAAYSSGTMPEPTQAASRLTAQPTPRENPRDVDRENAVLRELVTVYRHLSGLAMQDADLAGVVQLISERASATVAVVSQLMDVMTAASPGLPPEKAAALVRDHVVHPRLGQVLRAS